MKSWNLASVGLVLLLIASPGWADTAVNNYSWLQLPPEQVQSFALNGSQAPITGSQVGAVDSFRWGFRLWLPTFGDIGGGTNAGDGFYAGLNFTEPRNIEHVTIKSYNTSSAGIKSFTIEGSTDGVTFNQIGSHDYGSFLTSDGVLTDVSVTPGNYLSIRVKVGQNEFQGANIGNTGEPGLWEIQPFSGSTTISDRDANWINTTVFSTIATNHIVTPPVDVRNDPHWNSGLLRDQQNQNGQQGDWQSDDFVQVDLGAVRDIGRVILAWEHTNGGKAFNVQYSIDDVNFFNVSHLSAPIEFAPGDGFASTEQTFATVQAQYLRIINVVSVSSPGGYTLFSQVLAFTALPEPASLSLLALGGAAMLLRRRAGRSE